MSQVFKQDLTDTSVRPGGIFFVELFGIVQMWMSY